ncbi:Peptidyl-prolyl cis-trans isomerase (rotamase)-cyclophilin family [Muriicola jejuensis]|uniref:peptidylprolyl isomerase n=1 Tax=Muriicola jejuensis TaxID=504488 RepID=A0A6P0UDX1_9FLAO|nr:peptidylprolyl isomerase [Muriicola jejuensis]NER10812.1 peptidylprolyl isomerase [Muriicola jejuensis]SMP16214.1 Peptidyl-prolyl cis-trans isomerase (rotamase)-cyclophilin family [Muriicola jejuensis]
MKNTLILVTALMITLMGCKSSQYTHLGDGLFADIKTSKGDIIVKLEHEKTPVTVANFISLAEGTNPFVSEQYKEKRYYDGVLFHRVMEDFMIQGGDPTGTRMGNPGYRFKDEIVDSLRHDRAGVLSMANGGPKTNGSQFFITLKPTPWLDGKHTVFGEVVEGMDVVDSIGIVETDERDKPLVDVVMNKIEIIRNGKEARNFDAVKIMSDYFAEEEAEIAAFEKMKEDLANEIASQKNEIQALPSGLKLMVIEEGTGEKPKIGQQVLVNYAGYLENGDLFDSNYEEIARKYQVFDPKRKMGGGYEPFPMTYSMEANLISGFKEGLLTMKVGDKIRVFIPPHLGYGQQGLGPVPPNADLVFDLEITGIYGE